MEMARTDTRREAILEQYLERYQRWFRGNVDTQGLRQSCGIKNEASLLCKSANQSMTPCPVCLSGGEVMSGFSATQIPPGTPLSCLHEEGLSGLPRKHGKPGERVSEWFYSRGKHMGDAVDLWRGKRLKFHQIPRARLCGVLQMSFHSPKTCMIWSIRL